MSIQFDCPSCSATLRVAASTAGKKCQCPSCREICVVPNGTASNSLNVACPSCNTVLRYGANLEGTRGLCKACNTVFTLSQNNPPSNSKSTSKNFGFKCPRCSFVFEGKPGMEGRKGKCTECAEVFVIKPLPNSIERPVSVASSTKTPAKSKGEGRSHSSLPPTGTPRGNPVSVSSPKPRPSSQQAFTSGDESQDIFAAASLPAAAPSEPNVWDTLNLPAPSQSEVLASNYGLENAYASSVPEGIPRVKPPPLKRDRETLISIAYWHRAIIMSFLITIVMGILLAVLAVSVAMFREFIDANPPLPLVLSSLMLIPIFIMLFCTIRYVIGIVVLAFKLYEIPTAIIFLIGFFGLSFIPFVSLVLLIVLISKATIVLKAARFDVGFLGVEPHLLNSR